MGPEIIVFDLNGTLLDLSVLDGHFTRIFGSASYTLNPSEPVTVQGTVSYKF